MNLANCTTWISSISTPLYTCHGKLAWKTTSIESNFVQDHPVANGFISVLSHISQRQLALLIDLVKNVDFIDFGNAEYKENHFLRFMRWGRWSWNQWNIETS